MCLLDNIIIWYYYYNKDGGVTLMKKVVHIISVILMILAFIVQIIAFFSDSVGRTVAISYFICLFISGMFLIFMKKRKIPLSLQKNLGFKFIFFGSLGAVFVEVLFWLVEIVVGSHGVAAHPNIFIDLAVTMPWYILMITIFWFINKKCGFSWKTTMLLGGVYEVAADGIVGHILGGNGISLEHLLMLPLFYGVFVFVYFPMLAMPLKYYDIKKDDSSHITPFKKFLYAMLPLTALIPFALIFIILFS